MRNPITRQEKTYNKKHAQARNGIERVFGIWKRRFPVLATKSRLRLKNTLAVIMATAVLHNIAIDQGEPTEPPTVEVPIMIRRLESHRNINEARDENEFRHQIISEL